MIDELISVAGSGVLLPNNLVFDGDSITSDNYTYVSRVLNSLSNIATNANHGVPGDTVADMVARINTDIATSYRSDSKNILVYMIGTNDLSASFDQVAFLNNLQTYYNSAKSIGYDIIIANGIIDSVRDGVQAMLNIYSKNKGTICDYYSYVYQDSRLQDYSNTTWFNADGVHLSDNADLEILNVGNHVLAEIVISKLNSIGIK